MLKTEQGSAHQAFGAMISALAHPAVLLDGLGRVVSRNPAFANHFGGIIGTRFADLLETTDKQRFGAFVHNCTVADKTTPNDFECVLHNSVAAINLIITPLMLNGEVQGLLCQSKQTMGQADAKLEYLMDHIDQGVWEYDTRTKTFVVSETWLRMRGLTHDDNINTPEYDWLDEIHPDDRVALKTILESQISGKITNFNMQYRNKHRDGHWFWVLCSSKVMTVDEYGLPTRLVGTNTDVTELRQNEAEMNQLSEKLRLAVDASGIGIWEFDPNTGTVFWDDTMLEIYGLDDGQNYRDGELWETYLHPDDIEEMVAYSDHCQKNGLDFSRDYRVIHASGGTRHIRSRASQVDVPGLLPKLIGVNIDVTEDYDRAKALEIAQAQLVHDAHHDALTGLANRRRLDEATDTFFENVPDDQIYAVVQLDLDLFKVVNDSFGHAAGDKVLTEVAKHLLANVGDLGLVSRTGGDEFTIFFETAPTHQDLNDLCQAIIDCIAQPIAIKDTYCEVGVSIGCAFGQGALDNPSDIFIKADRALYDAKTAGRNRFYMRTMDCTPPKLSQSPCRI